MNKTVEKALCPMEEAIRLKVLGVLNDQYAHGYAVYSRHVVKKLGISKGIALATLRNLVDAGYVVYCRGLMDEDDGMMAGSGWGLSAKGVVMMRELGADDPAGVVA